MLIIDNPSFFVIYYYDDQMKVRQHYYSYVMDMWIENQPSFFSSLPQIVDDYRTLNCRDQIVYYSLSTIVN